MFKIYAGSGSHAYRLVANGAISGIELQESNGNGGSGGFTTRFLLPNGGSFIIGTAALSTSATNGFLYLPTCAGAPTGAPVSHTGTVAAVYDSNNNQLCIYNGTWKKIALS